MKYEVTEIMKSYTRLIKKMNSRCNLKTPTNFRNINQKNTKKSSIKNQNEGLLTVITHALYFHFIGVCVFNVISHSLCSHILGAIDSRGCRRRPFVQDPGILHHGSSHTGPLHTASSNIQSHTQTLQTLCVRVCVNTFSERVQDVCGVGIELPPYATGQNYTRRVMGGLETSPLVLAVCRLQHLSCVSRQESKSIFPFSYFCA
jgi:hypothetical protein